MKRQYLWVYIVILISPVQYYVAQFDYSGTRGLVEGAYYLIVGMLVIATFAIISNRKLHHLFLCNLARSPYILFYCFWLLISQYLVVCIYGDLGYKVIPRLFGYILVALVGYTLFPAAIGRNGIRGWWTTLLFVGTIASLLGLFVGLTGNRELLGLRLSRQMVFKPILGVYATSGPFQESNMFGLVASLGVIAGLFHVVTAQRTLNRFVALLLVGICAAGVFFSWSRQIYLGLFMALWVWILIGKRTSTKLIYLLVGTAAILGIWWLALQNEIVSCILTPGVGLGGREYLWPAAIRTILDRPITGYGLDPKLVVNAMFTRRGSRMNTPMGAHNELLDLSMQAGLPMAILYASVFLISFLRLLTSSMELTTKRSLAAAMTLFIVVITFLNYTIGGASYGSLVLTILLGIGNIAPMLYGYRKKRSLVR